MVKKSKIIYIVGSIIIGVVSVLAVLLGLIASGAVDVDAARLVFVSESAEKVYDGTPLTRGGWKLMRGRLKKGDVVKATVTGAQTEAGTGENYFSVAVLDAGGADVTDAYEIECTPGKLTVSPRPISVVTDSAAKVYDGGPLTAPVYRVVDGEPLEGHTLTVEVTGSRTDAGEAENAFVACVKDGRGKDVTGNYAFAGTLGVLTGHPRAVSLITETAVKTYDGAPLTCLQWSVSEDSVPAAGHEIAARAAGTQTNVGQSKNFLADVVVREGEKEVTYNYEIIPLLGDLIVTPRALTIRSESDSKVYDGTPLTNGDWEIVSRTRPAEGQRIFASVSGTRTEVGESPNTIAEALVVDAAGKDVSSNYAIRLQEGTLVVKGKDGGAGGTPGTPGEPAGTLPDDGRIAGPDSWGEPLTAVRVCSERTGKIYLRYRSYGDYDFRRWLPANDYSGLLDSTYSLNYLPGFAMWNAGLESDFVRIETKGENYLLPYYMDRDEYDYRIQTSDVRYTGDAPSAYALYYYSYDYLALGAGPLRNRLGAYAEAERLYRRYVYDNYLRLPADTYRYFSGLIAAEGFDKNDEDAVAAVAKYIRGAAAYSLDYDRALDAEADVAVSFLASYREGVCQHYATAAAALYRALGIPARYVIGYVGETEAGEWTELTVKNAHAWVEVYLDGIGWMQVEVTGGGPGASGEPAGPDAGEPAGQKGALEIAPADREMKYDGVTALTPDGELTGLKELLAAGYTYAATVSGRQIDVGIGASRIDTFALYDPHGKEVTEEFKITFRKGRLHVYIKELTVSTPSARKIYDGTPLSTPPDEWSLSGALIYGHSVGKMTLKRGPTNVGYYLNAFELIVVDERGRDVTYMYKIVRNCGTLSVEAREILITARSASKAYDGRALTCPGYDLTLEQESGSALGAGDRISVTVSGSQTNVGYSQSTVTEVIVTNAAGEDVTANYIVRYRNGELRVTPS